MNIFFLSKVPSECAKFHCNKHVNKMLIEAAQLLCTARHILKDPSNIPYEATHQHTAIPNWLTKHPLNYYWVFSLGKSLAKEYTFRYNKIHKSEAVIDNCINSFASANFRFLSETSEFSDYIHLPSPTDEITHFETVYNLMTPPALAMPEQFKCTDAITSYRRYYALDKAISIDFRYTKRNPPEWVKEIQYENKEIVEGHNQGITPRI